KPSPRHKHVIHLDHNKLNNHADNLKWVTKEELTAHQQKSPRVIREHKKRIGRRSGNANSYTLNERIVGIIKKKINQGKTLRILAKDYKVTETQLLRIKRGINWGDVKAAK